MIKKPAGKPKQNALTYYYSVN